MCLSVCVCPCFIFVVVCSFFLIFFFCVLFVTNFNSIHVLKKECRLFETILLYFFSYFALLFAGNCVAQSYLSVSLCNFKHYTGQKRDETEIKPRARTNCNFCNFDFGDKCRETVRKWRLLFFVYLALYFKYLIIVLFLSSH